MSAQASAPPLVFLTSQQLAIRWHTSPGRLANMRSRGEGPDYMKIQSSVRYPLDAVMAYEAANRVTCSD